MNDNTQIKNNRAAGAITTAALFSIFIYSFVVSLPGIVINEVVETFSLDGADEGLMSALTSLGFMLSLFFTVLVQGRARKTTVMIIAYAVQSVMLFVCGISPTFFLLCIGCVFIGFSGGFIDTASNSVIVDVRKENSAKYLGYLHGLFGVGSLLAPVAYIWAERHTDWRGVHFALAVASILVMLIMCFLARNAGNDCKDTSAREHLFTKADLMAYLRIPRNVVLAFAGFFAMYAIVCTLVWAVRYMTLRYDAAELGVLSLTIYWICSTVNRFFLAQLVKRAPMKFFALGSAVSAISLLIGIFSGSPVVFCVMMGVFGFSSGHFIPVLVSECAKGYEGRTTFTTSFIMFVMCISRVISPLMIAFLSTQVSLTAGMMLPVAASFGCMVCGLLAKKSRPSRAT